MKKTSQLFITILLLFMISFFVSCHQNKMLDKPTIVFIDESNLRLEINRDVNNKYIDNASQDEYKANFLSALKDELQACNLVITDDPNKAEFTIATELILLKEYSVVNTVDDVASEYNGMTYVLSNCDVSSEAKLFKGSPASNVSIDVLNQFANKEEKLTNNRNVGDYIFATNKDNSSYRQKELNEKVFLILVEKCGKRTTASASQRLYKYIKKGK